MKLLSKNSSLSGKILIPASKSHTIRAVSIASAAKGTSHLSNVLGSKDAESCLEAAQKMGASVTCTAEGEYTITGFSGLPQKPKEKIDIGNSGTSLRLLTGLASLSSQEILFDGDESIRARPMKPLLDSLKDLGVRVTSESDKCPLSVKGPIRGGKTVIDGLSSQFLSSLLISTPLASGDTQIIVENLHEKPYVEMTLDWLKRQGIKLKRKGLTHYEISGGQSYKAFDMQIPADFSSAAFPLVASAITKGEVLLEGLDFQDTQGDKEVFTYLEKMGLRFVHEKGGVKIKGGELVGKTLDLNNTPDALPAMAVAACFAKGTTSLVNVAQARIKECDRISAVAKELSKLGAKIKELDDGLVIEGTGLKGAEVHGYHDHRMVMSIAVAGLGAKGDVLIDTADAMGVTYPSFVKDMTLLGADLRLI